MVLMLFSLMMTSERVVHGRAITTSNNNKNQQKTKKKEIRHDWLIDLMIGARKIINNGYGFTSSRQNFMVLYEKGKKKGRLIAWGRGLQTRRRTWIRYIITDRSWIPVPRTKLARSYFVDEQYVRTYVWINTP